MDEEVEGEVLPSHGYLPLGARMSLKCTSAMQSWVFTESP